MRRTIAMLRQAIGSTQQEDGHFVCQFCHSVLASAEWLLAAYWLDAFDERFVEPLVDELVDQQHSTGGWSATAGGPDEVGTSLLAYQALKLSGFSAADETMTAARRYLLSQGGIELADCRARRYLAIYGQIPYEACRLDEGGGFSEAENRAFERLRQGRALRQLGPQLGIGELFCTPIKSWAASPGTIGGRWRVGRVVHDLGGMLDRCLDKSHRNKAAGDSQAPWQWRGILWRAMQAKFCADVDPCQEVAQPLDTLVESLGTDPRGATRLLASHQPRQTAQATEAILATGLSNQSTSLLGATAALCQGPFAESHHDRAITLRAVCGLLDQSHPSGEGVPPEIQILVPETVSRTSGSDAVARHAGLAAYKQRLRDELFLSQEGDGSWQSCPYATATALSALAAAGIVLGNKKIDRAIRYLRRVQRTDGFWLAAARSSDPAEPCHERRPGAMVTTAEVLVAVRAVGLSEFDPAVTTAAGSLLAHQQPAGGWGENTATTSDRLSAEGPCSISDTAQVLLCLTRSGYSRSAAVRLGIDFLLEYEVFTEDHQAALEDDLPLPLDAVCRILLALCQWASADDNRQGSSRFAEDGPSDFSICW
jgi:hypothetical protein